MSQPIQLKAATLPERNSINHSPLRRPFFLIPLLFAGFALSPKVQAKTGPPINCNTSEGYQALFNITTGVNNTAFGCGALFADTTGSDNTATGSGALNLNTGSNNTATGSGALRSNTADESTAVGSQALYSNTGGLGNTAIGFQALFSNTGGYNQGYFGGGNTAIGIQALYSLNGTAGGTGGGNIAIGPGALEDLSTGQYNIALGVAAGDFITTGEGNIDIGNIGSPIAGPGEESHTIRIGSDQSPFGYQTRTFIAAIRGVTTGNDDAVPVVIDSAGQLGTAGSSARFKTEIKPIDKASEAILALKPVTFHYKSAKSNAAGRPQFGLIAEDVAKVNPDLVVRDKNGEIYTVRYEAVNAMLLNEFLKEHRKVEQQQRKLEQEKTTIAQLKSAVAKQESTATEQQKEIAALTTNLKEETAQIQKVSAQVKVNKSAPQIVVSDR